MTTDGMPSMFAGVVQHCTGKGTYPTPPCFDDLALFSIDGGAEQRTLASYPLEQQPSNVGKVGISYPSRGPTGDIWFVLTEPLCRSQLYRVDARTGHVSLVVKRCGFVMWSPVQSPSGKFLAYILGSGDYGANALVMRDLATGHEREILPVDAHGKPGPAPESVLPVKGTPSFNPGGGPGPINSNSPDSFLVTMTWSLDSSQLAVGHVAGQQARICHPANSCFFYPDFSLDIFDAASLQRVAHIHGPGICQIQSAAFDSDGLVMGQQCNVLADNNERVVQYASDLKTKMFETRLERCSSDLFVAAGGVKRDRILVSAYESCPKSPWPGKWPLENIGPQQVIGVLQGAELRTVRVYPTTGNEELQVVAW